MKRLLLCTFTLALMLFALASCFGENHVYSGPCDPSCNECDRVTREPEVDHTFADCSDTECDVCGEVREAVEHTYKSACSAKCEACGYAREDAAAHIYDSPCDAECNVCGDVREASEHIYSNDCDTDCNFCGALRVTNHTYTNACDKTCNVCGATRIPEAHTYSNACDSTCDVCGELRMVPNHVYSTVCDADCNVCGELRIAAAHAYDHACDGDCNVCGATRVVADHVYDNACDAECNTCQTVRSNIHDFGDWRIKSAADCDNAAVEVKYCALCGEEVTREGAPALGHVFDNDCDTACNRIKCTYKRAIEHAFPEEYVTKIAATCTSSEKLHRFCEVCGAEEIIVGQGPLGHEFDNDCDPECNREDCDFRPVITEEDHRFTEWATKIPADCFDDEIQSRVCETCFGEEERVMEGTALGHLWTNSCDTDCDRECGHTREIIHAFGDWATVTAATCTEAEVEIRICGVCGAEETQIGDAALDHLWTNACDTDCDRACGHTREIVHAFGDWATLTPATCTAAEVEIRICGVCGAEETQIGDAALDHAWSNRCDTECDRGCGATREVEPHVGSAANCTICMYCEIVIPGAAHVALESDCKVCVNCDAGTGKAHTPSATNCVICSVCGKDSEVEHQPNYDANCTECAICKHNLGTAHTDADSDGKCDKCPCETLPGENWFPWAPL